MQVALLPEVVFAEMVSVVADKDDGGGVGEFESVEFIEDLAELLVHVGHRGVVGRPHALNVGRPLRYAALLAGGFSKS